MAKVLDICLIGEPVLRQPARKITPEELSSEAFQAFIDELIATMRAASGAGIAANQVGRPVQLCVMEVSSNPRYPYKPEIPLTVLVNPELEPIGDECFDNYEGCLSVPNLRGVVSRSTELRVRALDRHGEAIDAVVRGITAGTYQHEVDHLAGVLFVDRVADPHSFTTWQGFKRYQEASFAARVKTIVARFGS